MESGDGALVNRELGWAGGEMVLLFLRVGGGASRISCVVVVDRARSIVPGRRVLVGYQQVLVRAGPVRRRRRRTQSAHAVVAVHLLLLLLLLLRRTRLLRLLLRPVIGRRQRSHGRAATKVLRPEIAAKVLPTVTAVSVGGE